VSSIIAIVTLVVEAMSLIAKLFKKSEKTKRRDKLEDVKRAMEAAKNGDMGPLTDLLNK
jgi:hypothetical protein